MAIRAADAAFWQPTPFAVPGNVPNDLISSQVWCSETQIPLEMGTMPSVTSIFIDSDHDLGSDLAVPSSTATYTVMTQCITSYFTQAPSVTLETVLTALDGELSTSYQVTSNPAYVPDSTSETVYANPTLPGVTPPPATKAKSNAAVRHAGWTARQDSGVSGVWCTLHSASVMAAAALWVMMKAAG